MPRKLIDADYRAVKAEMRALLIEVARARETITYSELCLRLQTVTLHYHSHIFHRLLRDVCREAWEDGDGQLCALVVTKQTGIPGGGYFERMDERSTDDLEAEWRQDLEAVFEHWSER